MFESDKDEPRSFGIAIDTIELQDDNGDTSGYRLERKGFYLPSLSLASREGKPGAQVSGAGLARVLRGLMKRFSQRPLNSQTR